MQTRERNGRMKMGPIKDVGGSEWSLEDILVVLGSSKLLDDVLGIADHGSYFLRFGWRTQLLPQLHFSLVLNGEERGVQRRRALQDHTEDRGEGGGWRMEDSRIHPYMQGTFHLQELGKRGHLKYVHLEGCVMISPYL